MAGQKKDFIIIDDSRLDCFIAEKMIRNTGKAGEILSFLEAAEALDYIKETPYAAGNLKTVLIVDIQMPIMNGFKFMEAFEKLPAEIQYEYEVFVLTSSGNLSDISRMSNYKSVIDILGKPLSREKVQEFFR